ncbi:MAG: hypothetical protein J0M17_21370 [Planctomycetes bacterium]|nr:hypothetical protein [Planctomycetota bacterium]
MSPKIGYAFATLVSLIGIGTAILGFVSYSLNSLPAAGIAFGGVVVGSGLNYWTARQDLELSLVRRRWMAGLLAAAATAILFAPLMALVCGWSFNKSFPEIFGAGDTARLYFDRGTPGVSGRWNGDVTAVFTNPDVRNSARLTARTRRDQWGNTINKSERYGGESRIWAEVTLPKMPDLDGRKLTLSLRMTAKTPVTRSDLAFVDETHVFQHVAVVTPASPGAGAIYRNLWWAGESTATTFAIATLFIALSMRESVATSIT